MFPQVSLFRRRCPRYCPCVLIPDHITIDVNVHSDDPRLGPILDGINAIQATLTQQGALMSDLSDAVGGVESGLADLQQRVDVDVQFLVDQLAAAQAQHLADLASLDADQAVIDAAQAQIDQQNADAADAVARLNAVASTEAGVDPLPDNPAPTP